MAAMRYILRFVANEILQDTVNAPTAERTSMKSYCGVVIPFTFITLHFGVSRVRFSHASKPAHGDPFPMASEMKLSPQCSPAV
ncbi:lumazine synthase [Anopheles sinensis]|uniref:Lumazine synthase n=1 Tax=Anopheles sinensis TaxID=74873 RepID=A0A084WG64_ANOSI|nr:lumazine synthase [Anopheles sinensis]